uniref:Uridine kinase n=1 Tax=Rhodococcus sp. NS1 TaxID=402236 RepID=A0A097SPK7_9NOCA|nr:hypothetical protein LRS1606.31 [Rhodococcus sp. NS1]
MRAFPSGRAFIAVDGVDGSGKSTFSARLVQQLHPRLVVVLHAHDFLNPAAVRHAKGKDSPEGFWTELYNYSAMKAYALDPLGRDGDGWYRPASYDSEADRVTCPSLLHASEEALVLVEGLFLHRDELVDLWDLSIFLDVPFAETARRMAERDGTHPDPEHDSMRRYIGGQRIYFERTRPWERATIIVDNTNFDDPRIIDVGQVSAAR